mmetsp:Transcript_100232/g.272524  ORF Transcript_100232/g.272524 Transcript_100232/m.272524 type:complete len:234 (-) Transcript_100232:654-1355(-)
MPSSGGSKFTTRLTSFTSRPLPATLVATSMGASPLRKFSMAFSRFSCFRFPWSTSTLVVWRAFCSFFASTSASSDSPAKISTRPGSMEPADEKNLRRRVFKAPSLSPSSLTMSTRWSMSGLALRGSFSPTRHSTGTRVTHVARSVTSESIVAENSDVWRVFVSTSVVIFLILSLSPSPSMWSASSRISQRTFLTPNQCASFSMKSQSRPTVPTTHSGRSRRDPSCCRRRPSPP